MLDAASHDLVRLAHNTRHGVEVIHRAGCPHVKGHDAVRWNWAEGRPVSEWLSLSWFRACKTCRPDSEGVGDEQ